MRELTDEHLIDNLAGFHRSNFTCFEAQVLAIGRAAIAADRALNAPADRDVMRQSGLLAVQEADTIPYIHPEYGPGIFFTGDAIIAHTPPAEQSIDMVLHCPKCGRQHIDAPDPEPGTYPDGHETLWTNPAHRSHLCHDCGHIWRPADVATNGVAATKTKGTQDTKLQSPAEQQGEQEPVAEVQDMKYNAVRFYRKPNDQTSPYLLPGTKLYTHPAPDVLATLRAKVEALQGFQWALSGPGMIKRDDVLTEIDKLGSCA